MFNKDQLKCVDHIQYSEMDILHSWHIPGNQTFSKTIQVNTHIYIILQFSYVVAKLKNKDAKNTCLYTKKICPDHAEDQLLLPLAKNGLQGIFYPQLEAKRESANL